jgi:hypothetical protein
MLVLALKFSRTPKRRCSRLVSPERQEAAQRAASPSQVLAVAPQGRRSSSRTEGTVRTFKTEQRASENGVDSAIGRRSLPS